MDFSGLEAKHKRAWLILFVGLGLAPIAAGSAYGGLPAKYELADLKALERAFEELADNVRPSVVAIRTYQVRDPSDPNARLVMRPNSQGSGFVVASDGYIATNRHVIAGADVISVILDNGLKYDATLVQADPRSDLAVLKIEAQNLRSVAFGDVQDVQINQWAFACGNPFGFANQGQASVSFGVVSALGRQMTHRLVGDSDVEYYGNMIETSTDMAHAGSSGGPLFDIDGQVIGIVAAIENRAGEGDGPGFAIPVDRNTRRILDALKKGKEVRYGFLGVWVQDVEPPRTSLVVDARAFRGAALRGISIPDGPAARAGLKAKDVIMEYDGVAIKDSDHLVRLVGFTPVGSEVAVTYLRNGVKRETTVTVGDRAEMLGLATRKSE